MMVRGIVVALLCLLAMPSAAQYNIRKMMEEGRRTLDQGYYVTSMQLFSRIVALQPNLYEAWYLMALAKYHLEDYKGADGDCRRALALQPYIAEIYDLYGMVSIREGHYDSAVVAYTHALDICSDNRDYWFNRAYSLYQAAACPSGRTAAAGIAGIADGRGRRIRPDEKQTACPAAGPTVMLLFKLSRTNVVGL